MITIVDYGLSNLRSIEYKLKRHFDDVKISRDVDEISNSKKLILAGVGHFGQAMQNLNDLGLIDILNQKVLVDKVPIFGICLGMQLFTEYSEEGNTEGFGWIKGHTKKFQQKDMDSLLRIPHVGWNTIDILRPHPIFESVETRDYYFTHSYFVSCKDEKDILSTTFYGSNFVSSLSKDNILGTQFHPEKSHQTGFQLLVNFVEKNA